MDDKTRHVHICGGCGDSWECAKPDCFNSDQCTECEIREFEEWTAAEGWQEHTPLLPWTEEELRRF